MSLHDGWKMIRAVGPWMLHPALIWEIAAVGLAALICNKKVRSEAAFSLGFLIFSALRVLPGFYFRPHYFILLLPAVALWTGVGVAATQEWLLQRQSHRWLAWMPVLVFVLAFAFSIHGQRKFFFWPDPRTAWLDSHGCGSDCSGRRGSWGISQGRLHGARPRSGTRFGTRDLLLLPPPLRDGIHLHVRSD
jgi:hypothetical protein